MTSRWVVLVGGGVVAATVALAFAGWPASTYAHSDMYQFWYAPRILLEGRDPYAVWDWPYPLWTAVPLLPLGALPFAVAAPAWLAVQVGLCISGLLALGGRIFRTDRRRDLLLLLGIAAASEPMWLLAGGGNLTGFLFALLAFAIVALLAGRYVVAGILIGLLLLKPTAFIVAVPALVLLGPRAGRRSLLAGAVLSSFALVVTAFALRPQWPTEWLVNVSALQASQGSNATGWTIGRALLPDAAAAVSAGTVILALAALGSWWVVRRPPRLVATGTAIAISLYVAPHGWSYDHLHLLIVYAVTLELLAQLPVYHRIAGLIALASLAVAVPWSLYAHATVVGGEELSAIVPLLAFGLLIGADALAARVRPAARLVLRPAGSSAEP